MNPRQHETDQKTVAVEGMSCSGCADTMQNAFESAEGVLEASVDLENQTVTITHEPASVSEADCKQIVTDAGYQFKGIR